MPNLVLLVVSLQNALTDRLAGDDRERGDVPGWVLITLMTAGIVTVLWGVAGPELEKIFKSAVTGVKGPGGGTSP